MADATIQILIEAQDKVTATLKNIEGTLGGMAKNSAKQSQAISQGFTSTTDSLIALGNAAATVDNIFSSLTNMQLRLENANERLANAQDRVSDAQTKLNRLQKSGTASAEDLADASQEVERANRGLTISQNNLARAQNQVIGTYINIGVQVIALSASLPKLKLALEAVNASMWRIASNPLGIVLIALAGVITLATLAWKDYHDKLAEISQINDEMSITNGNLQQGLQKLADTATITRDAVSDAYNKMRAILGVQSSEEKGRIAQIQEQEYELARDRGTLSQQQIDRRQTEIDGNKRELEAIQKKKDAILSAVDYQASLIAPLTETQLEAQRLQELPYGEAVQEAMTLFNKFMKEASDERVRIMQSEIDANIAKLNEQFAALQRAYGIRGRTGAPGTNIIPSGQQLQSNLGVIPQYQFAHGGIVTKPTLGLVGEAGPEAIIPLEKLDRMGGGISITITGPIYGVNAQDISRALLRELSRKVTI